MARAVLSHAASRLVFIGFGEAATAFAEGLGAIAYDRKTGAEATRAAKWADYARAGVVGAASNAEAVSGAGLVLSLVTADRALEAAQETAQAIAPGALYCDMNSVAPATKRAAAAAIERAGAHYADVAVLAPVHPARRSAPLLVSGAVAEEAARRLGEAGFSKVRAVGPRVGDASAIKMIRSVMVKGIEALSAECALAADRAGVLEEVVASLHASWPEADWRGRFDYNLERMMVHGLRRAEEMEEVVKTLEALGAGSAMSRATAVRQREIGAMALGAGGGLDDKLQAIRSQGREEAA